MLPTQPYPESYLQALQEEAAHQPEFPPESFGDPEEDPGWCRANYRQMWITDAIESGVL